MRSPPCTSIVRSKKRTSRLADVAALASAALLCGCEGIQSALMPRGPQAQIIANISWIMFFGAAAILLLVICLALYATLRRPEKRKSPPPNKLILAGGVALPVLTLTALLIYGVDAMGTLRAKPIEAAMRIDVVGNRWWWDVHYRNPDGSVIATTANEIHLPAGQPVAVQVTTNDVIHSFWVPNLAGKIDLIPGHTNHITLEAHQPGVFRGQCAEFCGAQHARMAFYVIAHPAASFEAWLDQQRRPAVIADNATVTRGRAAFVQNQCITCHTVRGVGEAKARGPDLTHFASRKFIAAGTLENNRSNLLKFVKQSQEVKPGSGMPAYPHLDEGTLHDIADFLESLE